MTIRTIEENGQRFAVLPMEDFQALRDRAEMAADIAAYDYVVSLDEEAFPIVLYDAIDRGENALRVFREYRGMTQEDLAQRAGIQRPMISDIENGKKSGSIATVKKLAQILDVALDDLV